MRTGRLEPLRPGRPRAVLVAAILAALRRIADLKSAALQKLQGAGICRWLAECNSAIPQIENQIENLRYNATRTVLIRRCVRMDHYGSHGSHFVFRYPEALFSVRVESLAKNLKYDLPLSVELSP